VRQFVRKQIKQRTQDIHNILKEVTPGIWFESFVHICTNFYYRFATLWNLAWWKWNIYAFYQWYANVFCKNL